MSPHHRPMSPTHPEYGQALWQRLEEHMWIGHFTFVHAFELNISGLLKPQPTEGEDRAVRHMFMDVLDQALEELAALDAENIKHPDVRITDEGQHSSSKPKGFSSLRCEVRFYLRVQR